VPECDDYVVLKPKHSAFFQTPLDILLKHLGTKKLVLAGFCTNSCILFTAQDAYMRDLELLVPADCVASHTIEVHETALQQMKMVTKADVARSSTIEF
jgi:nicotinamidase-related amidase